MRYSSLAKVFCIGLCLTKPMLASAAEESKSNSLPNKKLIISTIENHPLVPFATSIMRQAYKKLGYDIEIWALPAARALYMSSNGKVDTELGRVNGLDKKHKNLIQINPAIVSFKAALISKNYDVNMFAAQNNANATIVLMRGMPYADKLVENRQKIEVNNIEQVIKILDSNRANYALIDGNYLSLPSYKNKLASYHSIDIDETKQAVHHYIHQKNSGLAPALEKVLTEMQQQGLLGN